MKILTILKYALVTPAYAQVPGGNVESHLDGGWPFQDLGKLLSNLLGIALIASGIMLLGYLMYGGIRHMNAGGDIDKMEEGRKAMTNALIGFVLVISTYAIMKVIETVFGVSILGGITLPRP